MASLVRPAVVGAAFFYALEQSRGGIWAENSVRAYRYGAFGDLRLADPPAPGPLGALAAEKVEIRLRNR
jgi:hypothetical protein